VDTAGAPQSLGEIGPACGSDRVAVDADSVGGHFTWASGSGPRFAIGSGA
jgi:hypothetical protein